MVKSSHLSVSENSFDSFHCQLQIDTAPHTSALWVFIIHGWNNACVLS